MDAQVRHVSYALSEVVDLKCGVSPPSPVIYLWGFLRNPIMRIVSGSDRVEYIFLNINTRSLLTHNYGSRRVFSCSRSPCMCDATAAGCCCTLITKGSAMSSCDHVSEEVLLPEWVLAIANCAAAQITLREQAIITFEAKHQGRGGTLLRGSWELLASLEVGGVGLQLGQRLLRLGLVLRLRVHSFIRPPSTTKHLQPTCQGRTVVGESDCSCAPLGSCCATRLANASALACCCCCCWGRDWDGWKEDDP